MCSQIRIELFPNGEWAVSDPLPRYSKKMEMRCAEVMQEKSTKSKIKGDVEEEEEDNDADADDHNSQKEEIEEEEEEGGGGGGGGGEEEEEEEKEEEE
ncbi:hypothetical protein T09_4559 [Trichinella sp. T9]|nr:hypothetical protein T09_4559 [Trichinella sp. T9]